MKLIWNNFILGVLVNLIVAPIAYARRNKVKKGSFLWGFLSDNLDVDALPGDDDWRPKLKSKFWRSYLWMMRNPRQNWYWEHFVDGTEMLFDGYGKVKNGNDILSWRTMRCIEKGNWHGAILDFDSPLWGKQNITFKRVDRKGNVQNCYRKSTCIPYHVAWWIIVVKRRSGHENGLLQYNFTFPTYAYKKNKQGWQKWIKKDWRNITL